VLHDLIEEAVGLSEEIDALLVGDAKEMWECWKVGYITYHLCDSRYKLSELFLIKEEGDTGNLTKEKRSIQSFQFSKAM